MTYWSTQMTLNVVCSWRAFDLNQAELSNINQWATDNSLHLNPYKTLEIIFYARGRRGIQAETEPPPPYKT